MGLLLAIETIAQPNHISVNESIYWNGNDVKGTLLAPLPEKKIKSSMPLIIIIPGSGPIDRDGNIAMSPGKMNSYRYLADSLLMEGIATFRYDKPGVGESEFTYGEDKLRFEDNAAVVVAIVKHLQSRMSLKNIYLLGHSEGALVAFLASAQLPQLKGLISIASPAENAADLLQEQLSKSISDTVFRELVQAKLDSVREGHVVSSPPLLFSLLRPSVQPYLQSWFQYTPREEIAKLKLPLMLIHGEKDLQVSPLAIEKLESAAPEAHIRRYPHMNHVLKMVDDSESQNRASYMDEDFPLQYGLARDIRQWLEDL